jgi:hypothetical protein
MYAMIINEHALHLKICLFAVFLILEFNEGILETLAGALVPYDFTR